MTNQSLILAGGIGSRLGNITKKTPKPLIKLNNKIFILHLIKNLYRQGIRDFLILTWYKNKEFKKLLPRNYKKSKIRIIKENKKLGTGGSILNAKKFLKKSFFVLNGDTFFDINLRDLEFQTLKNKYKIGVALTESKNHDGKLSYKINSKNFLKKIEFNNKRTKLVSGGIYFLNKNILKILPQGNSDIDKDLILKGSRKYKIFAKKYNNSFIDIGTKETLKKASNFLEKNISKPCVFLDRDGVINRDFGYVYKKQNFTWNKNIFKTIKLINDNNYRSIIISNQAGIGRGYYTEEDLNKLNTWMLNEFNKKGCYIDDVYYCPYHPQAKIKKYKKKTNLRKPGNGMILQALKDWEIIKSKSFLIGDKDIDIMCGKKSRIKSYYVEKDIFKQIKKLIIKKANY